MYKRPYYETVKLADIYSQEWLHMSNTELAKPKILMPYLVEMGVFTHDRREGLPLRDILRTLDKRNQLDLIRGVVAERKGKNIYWSIRRVELEDYQTL